MQLDSPRTEVNCLQHWMHSNWIYQRPFSSWGRSSSSTVTATSTYNNLNGHLAARRPHKQRFYTHFQCKQTGWPISSAEFKIRACRHSSVLNIICRPREMHSWLASISAYNVERPEWPLPGFIAKPAVTPLEWPPFNKHHSEEQQQQRQHVRSELSLSSTWKIDDKPQFYGCYVIASHLIYSPSRRVPLWKTLWD